VRPLHLASPPSGDWSDSTSFLVPYASERVERRSGGRRLGFGLTTGHGFERLGVAGSFGDDLGAGDFDLVEVGGG
jgi:hypothetical protein